MPIFLPKPPRNIILGAFVPGVCEHFFGIAEFYQFSEEEEGRLAADPRRLVHGVSYDDYAEFFF